MQWARLSEVFSFQLSVLFARVSASLNSSRPSLLRSPQGSSGKDACALRHKENYGYRSLGASGAVSGVIGAYVLLYPKARVWILLFFRIPLRISAIWVLGGWFLLQVFSVLTAESGSDAEVAWWAHIGGFIAGLAITLILRSRLLIRS